MINNLDSIILGIKDGEKAIEDLRVVLKKRKEEVITTQTFIALFTIIRTDRNMLLACYSHKHISYRIRTIIRKAIITLYDAQKLQRKR